MNDCASAGENQIRGCSLSRAIGAITPQHSQHLIIFVKKSVAIPTNFNGRLNGIQAMPETFFVDSNGNIVGDTYSGAKSAKEWKQVIEKELEKIKNK